MTLTVEAVYENGVLKLAQPLPLREQQRVRLQVQVDTVEDAVQRVRATAGLIPCIDDELIEWAATDADLDFPAPEES